MDAEKPLDFTEVTVTVTMSKSIFIETPENYTREELLERVKNEIITPNKLIEVYKNVLNNFNIQINNPNIDISNWSLDSVKYETDYKLEQ